MSEYTAPPMAAITQQPLMVTADCNADVLLQATQGCMRLAARVRHATALAQTAEIQLGSEEEHLKEIEDSQRTAQVQQYVSHSHSVYELFSKPASKLCEEEEDLKREIKILQKFVELDQEQSAQKDQLKISTDLMNTLTKEWDEIYALFKEKNMENMKTPNSENNELYPEKQSVENIVNKMSVLREILIRLIPVESSYDSWEDKEDLLGVLGTLREPFTVESIIKDIRDDVEE